MQRNYVVAGAVRKSRNSSYQIYWKKELNVMIGDCVNSEFDNRSDELPNCD